MGGTFLRGGGTDTEVERRTDLPQQEKPRETVAPGGAGLFTHLCRPRQPRPQALGVPSLGEPSVSLWAVRGNRRLDSTRLLPSPPPPPPAPLSAQEEEGKEGYVRRVEGRAGGDVLL